MVIVLNVIVKRELRHNLLIDVNNIMLDNVTHRQHPIPNAQDVNRLSSGCSPAMFGIQSLHTFLYANEGLRGPMSFRPPHWRGTARETSDRNIQQCQSPSLGH